ncbi:MAG: DNA-binding response regulator, partial [Planctomycetota bacterium]
MLPGVDGLSILRKIRARKKDAHVLILTARDTVQDRVAGLDCGADDYLVKPFAFAELLARVRALVRRNYNRKSSQIVVEDLRIDL